MVKSLKNQKIQKKRDAKVQGQEEKKEQRLELKESLSQEMEKMEISREGKNVSGRGQNSSADGSTEAILKEESIPSTAHYYSPAPGPVSAPVQPQQTGKLTNLDSKRKSAKATKLIKKTSLGRRVKRSNQQETSISQPRTSRKINHRKYTVKKCSNFIRKTLKKNGFKDFKRLEGGCTGAPEDRNRRGSTIYLPVGLLILRYILKSSFKTFVKDYLKNLSNLQETEERKLKANRNEKSLNYIIEFKRARESILLFEEGKEVECIEKFFGAHEDSYKERTYLRDSIEFYNRWKQELEGRILVLEGFEVESLEVMETAPEVEMMEIETPVMNNQNAVSDEDLFDCLSL